tara:strand:+ start:17978 stop:19309 length:1332 start_codon:yes stop_codon:yes gene_type:complete
MKKIIIFICALIVSCDLFSEEDSIGNLFTFRGGNLLDNHKLTIYIHDSLMPSDSALVWGEVGENDSIVFDLDTAELSLISSLITTIVTTDTLDSNIVNIFTYYGMPVGMDYTESNQFFTHDGSESVGLTIEAPSGKNISEFRNDTGNYYYYGWGRDTASITYTHQVYSNKLTIVSSIETTDNQKYVGILEDQDWVNGKQFTLNNWTQSNIDEAVFLISEPPWSWGEYGRTRLLFYNQSNGRASWLSDVWFEDNFNLIGSGYQTVEVMSSSLNPLAVTNRATLIVDRGAEGNITNSTNYGFYNNIGLSSSLKVKSLPISFTYNSTTKEVSNLIQSPEADYIQLLYISQDGPPLFIYVNADEFNYIALPNIPELSKAVGSYELYRARPIDFDIYKNLYEVMKSISDDYMNFYKSYNVRHHNYNYYNFNDAVSKPINSSSLSFNLK